MPSLELETLLLPFAPAEVWSEHDSLPVPQSTLFLGAQWHQTFATWQNVIGYQPYKPFAADWEAHGATLVQEPSGTFETVLLLPNKSKEETLAWFALARRHLAPNGRIVVAMSNAIGASRFEKELITATGKVVSMSKNKCRVFHAWDDGTWNEDIFSSWAEELAPRVVDGFHTEVGVFSADGIDLGSRFLAENLPASLHGKVADLGAGWGYLSASVLEKCPRVKALHLFEADSRALACATKNVQSVSCDLHFHWADVTQGLGEAPLFDHIVMNPPFHIGKSTDVDLGKRFIEVAVHELTRSGQLYIVANRQLPYEKILDELPVFWRKTAENPTFKLLLVTKR